MELLKLYTLQLFSDLVFTCTLMDKNSRNGTFQKGKGNGFYFFKKKKLDVVTMHRITFYLKIALNS